MKIKTKANQTQMKMKRSVKITLIAIVAVLIIGRAILPTVGKHYINKTLKNGIEGYTGSIDDLDISLYRGAYQIEALKLFKVEKKVPSPFLDIKEVDFSIAWKPLFKGNVVGKILVDTAKVNFVNGPTKAESQSGVDGGGWRETLDKMMPLKIERLEVRTSEVHFQDFHKKPKVDVFLYELGMLATNLRNSDGKKDELVSDFTLDAKVKQQGTLAIRSKLNVLRDPAMYDVNLAMEGVDLPAYNDFFKAYGKFDVNKGRLDFYAEAASADNKIKGYLKPILTNVKVLGKGEDYGSIGEFLGEWGAGSVNGIIRRYSKDQVGVKVPFEGSLDNPKVAIWPSVKSMFRHAFGAKPLPKTVDDTIDINSARRARATPKGQGVVDVAKGEGKSEGDEGKAKAKEPSKKDRLFDSNRTAAGR